MDVDINGDGVGDLVFANYTAKGNVHSYFSYSINVRDGTDSDLLHSVHIYPAGYEPGGGLRILNGSRAPECVTRAHFLIRDEDSGSYELLTADRVEKFPPRPGAVEFTFHRLRTLETVAEAWYVFDGYRKVRSKQEYCDVVEAATQEVLAFRSRAGSPLVKDKEQRGVESVE